MKKVSLILTIFCSLSVVANAQYRYVYWLHGYMGDNSSLRIAGNFAGGVDNGEHNGVYAVRSQFPDYSADATSLINASNQVKATIEQIGGDRQVVHDDFIIAHSQGGLVARQMQLPLSDFGEGLVNGLITFGTPHGGAAAADVLVSNPQLLEDASVDACQSLVPGLIESTVLNDRPYLRYLLGFTGWLGKIDVVCESAIPFPVNNLVGTLSQGIAQDLTVANAPNIPQLSTANDAIFYGVEDGMDDGSLAARFFGAFLFSPPNVHQPFQADVSDNIGIMNLMSLKLHYRAQELVFRARSNPARYPLYFAMENGRLADAYGRGVDWFGNLNDTWMTLIGALDNDIVQVGCDCEFEEYYGDIIIDHFPNLGDCDNVPNGYDWCYPHMEVSPLIRRESDGFILSESSETAPGLDYAPMLMQGSNHMQMKNDANMAIALEEIFASGLGATFFISPK